jgi:osmotically-inducible protein OsmY
MRTFKCTAALAVALARQVEGVSSVKNDMRLR